MNKSRCMVYNGRFSMQKILWASTLIIMDKVSNEN